jgi:recombination protein RecR
MTSDTIKKLTDLFAKFPTIGSRTASRFVFYLLKLPKEKVDEIIEAIQELKKNVKSCRFCFNNYESSDLFQDAENLNLCRICKEPNRNRQILCIVERETDLISIENTKKYNGLYFIIGGILASRKNNSANLRINELKERMNNPLKFGLPFQKDRSQTNFTEIIVATNPTPEGKLTSNLIEKAIKELANPSLQNIKITHLAQGLPVGGELEYADEETLKSAFEGRK